ISFRPSFGDKSRSASNQSYQPSSGSASGSNPRRVCNKTRAEPNCISIKRRRVPDSITRNACLKCKKARAKVSTGHDCLLFVPF
ncbi:hypothetical protein B0O99DRAFT_611851, partial [Bisporella sp. PMI_857]